MYPEQKGLVDKMKRKKMIICIIMCCLLLVGCGGIENVNNELTRPYTPSDSALVLPTGGGSGGKVTVPDGYEKVLENDYLALYIGTGYDIGVLNKATGHITWSNEAYATMTAEERGALNADAKSLLLSQVSLEYYTSSLKKTSMSSYPDAYSDSKNQVSWTVENDCLTVVYGLGNNIAESGLIQCFTADTYNKYQNQLQEMVDAKELSIMDARVFQQQYLEYKYDSMESSVRKIYEEAYPAFEEIGTIYVLKSNISANNANKLIALYGLVGIDDSVREAESLALGGSGSTSQSAFFRIPVKMWLHGSDFMVAVDMQAIEVAEGFHLTKVELLKGFNATLSTEDGYIFLPDGSGSIIENDVDANSMITMSVAFYGADQGRSETEASSTAMNNTFPVFGIKKGGNAVFGIVENGAPVGGATARAHYGSVAYNMVYPYFYYEAVDAFDWESVAYAFYDIAPNVEYTVRYHFLSGEDASYSGMARYYQQYLTQMGVLHRQEESGSVGLDIEFLGTIDKPKNYLGIPVTVKYPLTTFEQAQEIVDKLHEGGIGSLDVLYSGTVNGGMNQKALNKLSVQKELGGTEGYQELKEALASQGDGLYPGFTLAMIGKRGNGIRRVEDVIRNINKNAAFVGEWNAATGTDAGFLQFMVNPRLYAKVTDNFLKLVPELGINTLYLGGVGTYLSGNYSEKQGVTRQTAMYLTEDMVKSVYDAGYRLKLDCGNDYILKYADSLVNVPTSSSSRRLESYSVPFVGMVLKGYLPYTCSSINQAPNGTKALLEAVESGAGLNYLLMYDNQLDLQDTEFSHLYSVNYTMNLEEIFTTWNQLNQDLGYLTNVRIVGHEHVSDEVNCVLYEDGSKIYVNYGKESYKTSDGIVEAQSYLVIGGE